ncbi:Wadjet anti-phage system protein JetD domain-containing protein [Microlunatus parietis]|uniref:Wadjet protein JetD C-terminal domain-containing protein n=1 Tax=Microlunatus parietis TaxID=682979 RepID=A0A7Y9IBP1_9ACTN|nr:Wadjet anti-phage system protein JetD domain-containing protein [Microlunatus parietis]NYE73857.1 hypothetical protein [Microlunatus parietis]
MTDIERFVAELREAAGRRTRVDTDEIWRIFIRLFVDASRAVDARKQLAELIGAAGEAGLIQPSVSTDNLAPIPLPRFVKLIDGRPARVGRRPVPWVDALAWASDVDLSDPQYDVLDRVNRWLRDGGAERPIVPAEERSAELFDDEKAIARRVGGTATFWRPDRLSPTLLRYENVPIPFAYRVVGEGTSLLMVENTAAFRTCARLLAAESGHPYCAVAFGQGTWAAQTITAALDHPTPITEVHYWGDLDVWGLEITREVLAAARTVDLTARVHTSLWTLMLSKRSIPTTKGPTTFDPTLVDVLPVQLRQRAITVLAKRHRIPQERVGYELLLCTPRWWEFSGH